MDRAGHQALRVGRWGPIEQESVRCLSSVATWPVTMADARQATDVLSRLHRSLLFVPGNDRRKVSRASEGDADIVILDLEDAVAPANKADARAALVAAIESIAPTPVLVRVNRPGTHEALLDVEAAVKAGATGVVVPKVDTAEAAMWCHDRVAEVAGSNGPFPLVPLIESARGLLRLAEILDDLSGVPFAALGTADLAQDLDLPPEAEDDRGGVIDAARLALVLHSRAAGVGAPVDGPEMRIRDLDRFRRRCDHAVLRGFGGILCLHPEQVEVANRRFSPDAESVVRAERVVAAFEEASADGRGAITVDDEFVDLPVVERSRSLLATAQEIARREMSREESR